MLWFALGLIAAEIAVKTLPSSPKIEWSQTARFDDGTLNLLKQMPPLEMTEMSPPTGRSLIIDVGTSYQEILGFGGAFTEASALNWRKLSEADQEEVIRRYFASPAEGGLGYTLGRVPINSCDFGPGDWRRTYSFDNVSGDVNLEHFDDNVSHDVESGIIPMIRAAQRAIEATGAKLTLFASPWSPPHWMKVPVDGTQSMLATAKPNGLLPAMQRPWAKYFSRFISACAHVISSNRDCLCQTYTGHKPTPTLAKPTLGTAPTAHPARLGAHASTDRRHGINIWGVTIQNEPEAGDVGWEKCLWTPEFQSRFVKEHLGPVLAAEQPGTKIIGFDHNKDHVVEWARGLYKDPDARTYFDGIGVHWYGGLNVHNLDNTHAVAPEKFILATEACNCPGVIHQDNLVEWWQRAEHIGMDILQDLLHWTTGWTDWNLILDPTGGPNHLGNRCDANLIADPTRSQGRGAIIVQVQ